MDSKDKEYIEEYNEIENVKSWTDRQAMYLALCDKYPDRCGEAYFKMSILTEDPELKFKYAKLAADMEMPSGEVIDRSIYEWRALDQVCIQGYYTKKFHDSILAHETLKERKHLIPEHYREQCIRNGQFSIDHVANIHSLGRFQDTIRALPKPVIANTDIPNYFHFVWFKGGRQWIMVHYLAVLLIHKIQNPLSIYIYNDEEPESNKWWDLVKTIPSVRIVKTQAPAHINNKHIPWVQHKADVARIYAIFERGGVYVDADLLIYKNISELIVAEKVNMSYQNAHGVWNGFIAAPPRHPFMKKWIDTYLSLYGEKDVDHWAGLSINMPFNLSNIHPGWVHLMPSITFLPLGWHDNELYEDGCTDTWPDSFGIHLWETEAEKRGVLPKDRDWLIHHNDTPFYRLFSEYLC